MKLTIIISYYKALNNLKIILKALKYQSCLDFEVIISEDDYNEETFHFITQYHQNYPFVLRHIHQQKDDGFRKNQMLNQSIRNTHTENIIFIDGDCIPHQHFVKEYLKNLREGFIFWGRRVMLGEKISSEILMTQSLKPLKLPNLMISDVQKIKDAFYIPNITLMFGNKKRGLKGCNWGIKKRHLFEINGFDEDYIQAGVGEDDDIEWRLKAIGLQMESMKNKAIVYHLYHPRTYSEDGVQANRLLMREKQKMNLIRCRNGLDKLMI